MDQAKPMIETKKVIYETAKARVFPTVKFDVSCCKNSNSCTVGDDCKRFVENCELKISVLSLTEKGVTDKGVTDTTDKGVTDTTVDVKEDKAVSDKGVSDTTVKVKDVADKISALSVKDNKDATNNSFSNNTLIIAVLLCCCLSCIIVIILIMMKK